MDHNGIEHCWASKQQAALAGGLRGDAGKRQTQENFLDLPSSAHLALPLMHTMSRLMQGNKLEKVHVSCTCGIASLFLSLAVAFVPQPICKGFRISMKVLVEFWPKFALCCTEVPSFVGAGGALSQSHTPPFQAYI